MKKKTKIISEIKVAIKTMYITIVKSCLQIKNVFKNSLLKRLRLFVPLIFLGKSLNIFAP